MSNQKQWLRNAWTDSYNDVYCIFPLLTQNSVVFNECNLDKIEWHHIQPQGYCKRVLHIDPDVPYNIAPICTEHHRVGQKGQPLDREHQDCIHIDAAWATKNYGGKNKPTSFDRVFEQRKRLTDQEIKYWNDRWDIYLVETVKFVLDNYLDKHPEEVWPTRQKYQSVI